VKRPSRLGKNGANKSTRVMAFYCLSVALGEIKLDAQSYWVVQE